MKTSIKMVFILLIGIGIFITGCVLNKEVGKKKTEILIIGTLHHNHQNNINYSYKNIIQILATYDIDVICVEIRPEDFRKKPYLIEMMMATIYGMKYNKKVYPIDWYSGENTRALREKLSKEPEYIEKQKIADSLELNNNLIQKFNKTYRNIWENVKEYDYKFWNGDEYNNYIRESYKISMQVFGDNPFNLYYMTRNQNMLNLINKAIDKNIGRKIIVLTGVEHKHFFDDSFLNRSDISLRKLDDILPLKKTDLDSEIFDITSMEDLKTYYDFGNTEAVNGYYSSIITTFLHGPNMDFKPNIIPKENIQKAKIILNEWRQKNPESIRLQFEYGWYYFLSSSYKVAIKYYNIVEDNLKKENIDDDFVKCILYRNLGWCYDMIGERPKAIDCYNEGEKLTDKTKFARMKHKIYQDYKTNPYIKGE